MLEVSTTWKNVHGAFKFNSDVSKWEVAGAQKMHAMFANVHKFNGDVSKWNVIDVLDMRAMFDRRLQFNSDVRSGMSQRCLSCMPVSTHSFLSAVSPPSNPDTRAFSLFAVFPRPQIQQRREQVGCLEGVYYVCQ